MDLNRILREGFIAGCIGAAVVAAWFLVVDSINGGLQVWPGTVEYGIHDLGFADEDNWVGGLLQSVGTTPGSSAVPCWRSLGPPARPRHCCSRSA